VVLETGLGGRLDATNVVNPLLSVLTSIDLDHQSWLGHSLSEIAFEKAGIIKPGVPIVSGPQFPEVRTVLEQIAAERSAPLSYVALPVKDLPIGLAGSHQQLNAAIALKAIHKAGIHVEPHALEKGFANVSWPGRFQRIDDRMILDGAHNPAAARRLVRTWAECVGPQTATIIFGAMRDKDLEGMIEILSTVATRFLIVPIRSRRSASPAQIEAFVPKHLSAVQCPSVDDALSLAHRFDDPILATGSLFLVGELLAILHPEQGSLQTGSQ
jgi:dihydrofolate synthase/folylpolyglutamate synthase